MAFVSTAVAIGTALGVTGTAAAGITGTAVIGAAAYGAYKGIEGIAGAGGDGGDAPRQITDTRAIETKAAEAKAVSEQKAKDETRKKLSQQTRTIFTSGLGLTEGKKPTTLGSN